jgi:hypothetical protein
VIKTGGAIELMLIMQAISMIGERQQFMSP